MVLVHTEKSEFVYSSHQPEEPSRPHGLLEPELLDQFSDRGGRTKATQKVKEKFFSFNGAPIIERPARARNFEPIKQPPEIALRSKSVKGSGSIIKLPRPNSHSYNGFT